MLKYSGTCRYYLVLAAKFEINLPFQSSSQLPLALQHFSVISDRITHMRSRSGLSSMISCFSVLSQSVGTPENSLNHPFIPPTDLFFLSVYFDPRFGEHQTRVPVELVRLQNI